MVYKTQPRHELRGQEAGDSAAKAEDFLCLGAGTVTATGLAQRYWIVPLNALGKSYVPDVRMIIHGLYIIHQDEVDEDGRSKQWMTEVSSSSSRDCRSLEERVNQTGLYTVTRGWRSI